MAQQRLADENNPAFALPRGAANSTPNEGIEASCAPRQGRLPGAR
jgi:hypothetical protein